MSQYVSPPVWSSPELSSAAAFSQLGVMDRLLSDEVYRTSFRVAEQDVLNLLSSTEDLLAINAADLIGHPKLVRVLRFCFGPPLSNDIVK